VLEVALEGLSHRRDCQDDGAPARGPAPREQKRPAEAADVQHGPARLRDGEARARHQREGYEAQRGEGGPPDTLLRIGFVQREARARRATSVDRREWGRAGRRPTPGTAARSSSTTRSAKAARRGA